MFRHSCIHLFEFCFHEKLITVVTFESWMKMVTKHSLFIIVNTNVIDTEWHKFFLKSVSLIKGRSLRIAKPNWNWRSSATIFKFMFSFIGSVGMPFDCGGHLSESRRIDFVLREGSMESSYISALTSHTSYWTNLDIAHFLLTILYPDLQTCTGQPPSATSSAVSTSSSPLPSVAGNDINKQ